MRTRGSKTSPRWLPLLAATAIIASPVANAEAAPNRLSVQVILARKTDGPVDPKLQKLAQQLKKLKFKSFQLKDHAQFNLEIGASGRMQLPGGQWMNVSAKGLAKKGKMLRTDISVENAEFRTTVLISKGATVVVKGPPFKGGTLILAIKRGG